MNNLSNEQLLEIIDEMHGRSEAPQKSSNPLGCIIMGALLGSMAAAIVLSGSLFGFPIAWVIGGAAATGSALNYAVSRLVLSERAKTRLLTDLHKDLIIVKHKEESDPVGSRFTAILREVISKDGITPRGVTTMINDIVHGRKEISEAYYVISAILVQVDSMKTDAKTH